MRYAEGENYKVDLSRGLAICEVWRRGDLSREQGMRCAEEKVEVFERLVNESSLVVRALVLDLREAPTMWGPVTQKCLEKMLASCERAARRIAVIVGDDAIQSLQLKRIIKERAAVMGRLFKSPDEGAAWARERTSTRIAT